MDRLDELERLYEITMDSVLDVEPDRRSALIGEARRLLQEIDELRGVSGGEASDGAGLASVTPLAKIRERRESRKSS